MRTREISEQTDFRGFEKHPRRTTVYRHFPNRGDLIVEVYRSELDAAANAVDKLLGSHDLETALVMWMRRFLAMRNVMAADPRNPHYPTIDNLVVAATRLLSAAQSAGHVRSDVDVDDFLMFLGGISVAADNSERDNQGERMLQILVRGLRPDGGAKQS